MGRKVAAGRLIKASSCLSSPALAVAAFITVLALASAQTAHAAPNTAAAWGSNEFGELGAGIAEAEGPEKCEAHSACSTVPVAVRALTGVEAMSAGTDFGLALANGGVNAWGENEYGELGDGTTTNSDVPVAVDGLSESVSAIAAGNGHSLALLSSGQVLAWGSNTAGQLGDGTTTNRSTPVAVCAVGETAPCAKHLEGVKAIAAAGNFSVALLGNETVVTWGSDLDGELGDGTTASSSVPVQVCAPGESAPCEHLLEGVSAITAGGVSTGGHAVALLKSGTLVAWGENKEGELGDGLESNSDVPVAVCGSGETAPCATHLKAVKAVAAGAFHTLAIVESEQGKPTTVLAWGENRQGELGDDTSTGPELCGSPAVVACAKTPVAVNGVTGVAAVAGGREYSLALRTDGSVLSWGRNGVGELGDGTSTGPEVCTFGERCSTKPVTVASLSPAAGISAGLLLSLAFGPPPAVTSVVPSSGPSSGGTTVTITGSDFTGATAVSFGSVPAASFTVRSSTSITAVSPATVAGAVDVTVANTWGVSTPSAGDRFTFVPTVTNVNPKDGPATGGTSVTIEGSGFATGKSATTFLFGHKQATSVSCASTTTCTVVTPRHRPRTVDVKAIVNGVRSARNRPADRYTYVS